MTIDEILCNIARDNALIFTEEEQDAMAEAILSVRERQWYKSQDLIKREDAEKLLRKWDKGECHGSPDLVVKQIPKAEPPIIPYNDEPIVVHNKEDWDRFQEDIEPTLSEAEKVERNGDCETCKHYNTEVCGECFKVIGDSKYEPYIPKEQTMDIYNTVYKVSNYATDNLEKVLNEYAHNGYELVSTEMARNEYGIEVMYLFFVSKENK